MASRVMQRLSSLLPLLPARAAGSFRSVVIPSTSATAASGGEAGSSAGPSDKAGPKTTLQSILQAHDVPLSSAQVWEVAEQEGLRSKRFTKQLLQQMKQSGLVKTKHLSGKKSKTYGYILSSKLKGDTAEQDSN